VAEALTAAFQQATKIHETGESTVAASSLPASTRHETSPLARVNLGLAVPHEDYDKRLPKLQAELRRLQHLCYVHRTPVVVLYEGWDAAGKGGNIRRLVRELDPRGYEVVPVAAPQGDEKTHHYLWRFWRALPKAGHISIFDRTWYGRVLVERIEGYARPCEWGRAYREINEFEAELADYGAAIIKFWLHISKEEQLARFEARQNTPDKTWKITEEDWRNRERWDSYWAAITDMVERTSTVHAPWTIVEANDKYHARVKALETVIKRIKTVIGEK
jgi:polyphosphate kinase 2 (PPK2 family)